MASDQQSTKVPVGFPPSLSSPSFATTDRTMEERPSSNPLNSINPTDPSFLSSSSRFEKAGLETFEVPGRLHTAVPTDRLSRSDVHFPLTSHRKRTPSIPVLTHSATEEGHPGRVLRPPMPPQQQLLLLQSSSSSSNEPPESAGENVTSPAQVDDCTAIIQAMTIHDSSSCDSDPNTAQSTNSTSDHVPTNIRDLPNEIQGKILDYIFGDMQPVNAASSTTGVSHKMRHPRRKAVSELALISTELKEMVQERIYRHIKIKATRTGLEESQEWFSHRPHLASLVRHIEYWVPVWGDKAAACDSVVGRHGLRGNLENDWGLANTVGPFPTHEFPGVSFRFSTYSATLTQIFQHLADHFPCISIFTLEGGHCKNSNMIKHFPSNLFAGRMNRRLPQLPQVKVFAMRGAWNIMRNDDHWTVIQDALPNLTEWHCGYAKPRTEAYETINEILYRLPSRLRRLDISLDGMFSKDDTVLGSTSVDRERHLHLCERLGRIAPHLESLSYTGKICECFWTAAAQTVRDDRSLADRLRSLEMVVKSCCRQRVKSVHPDTGEEFTEEVGGIMADGVGITNLVFVRAFERIVQSTVQSLATFVNLRRIKIRYIDLDSPCALLNPYWHLTGRVVNGIWNEDIVETLSHVRPDTGYEELGDGIGGPNSMSAYKKSHDDDDDDVFDWSRPGGFQGTPADGHGLGHHHGHGNPFNIRPHHTNGLGGMAVGIASLYPRFRPKSIKTSSYRILAEARAS